MADSVIRYQIADYLNTGGETEAWSFMNTGFNTLDENPSAQTDSKTYIGDKAQSTNIKGYQTSFPFDTDLISDEAAVMALYEIGRDQKTGSAARLDYIRVELFKGIATGKYPARKFRVAPEISSIAGAGGETIKVTGTLHAVGNFVNGTFDVATKTFTADLG